MAKPKKEVRDMLQWFLDIFDCKELRYLPDSVLKNILANNTTVYDEYIKEYPDLENDSLRTFFETYLSDRTFLSQDFTPQSIALLMTELALVGMETPPPEILDECAGIGSLIIPYWNVNKDVTVYARELSLTTIPFLLFNLAVRNMRGIVVRGDTLSLETQQVYLLNHGEKYSEVTEIDFMDAVKQTDPILILKTLMHYSPQRLKEVKVENE